MNAQIRFCHNHYESLVSSFVHNLAEFVPGLAVTLFAEIVAILNYHHLNVDPFKIKMFQHQWL